MGIHRLSDELDPLGVDRRPNIAALLERSTYDSASGKRHQR